MKDSLSEGTGANAVVSIQEYFVRSIPIIMRAMNCLGVSFHALTADYCRTKRAKLCAVLGDFKIAANYLSARPFKMAVTFE